MSKLYQYFKRGLKYIMHGVPNVTIEPNIITLSSSTLLKDRTALVLGGSRGIGYAIAEGFLKAGADVIITSRSSDNVTAAVEKLRSQYPSASVSGYVMDVTNIPEMKRVIDDIIAANPRIDILVNNAGVNGKTSLGNHSEEEWERIMNANLKGTYFLSEYLIQYMIKEDIAGNILNIASSSSIRPAINAYMASKWGIRGLTLGLAKICAPHNIVVNSIAPGPTATNMQKGDNGLYLSSSPIKRLVLPEEIANMVVMLVSDSGRSIIGDTLYMTGGSGVITYDDIPYNI